MGDDNFDWDNPDNDSVLIPRIEAIAIYINTDNNVVIRQRDAIAANISSSPYAQPEDACVILPRQYLPRIISKLKDLMSED